MCSSRFRIMREREKKGWKEGGRRQSIRRETIDGRTDGQVCEGLRLHFNTRRRRPEGGRRRVHGIIGMARGGGIRAVSNQSIKDPSY